MATASSRAEEAANASARPRRRRNKASRSWISLDMRSPTSRSRAKRRQRPSRRGLVSSARPTPGGPACCLATCRFEPFRSPDERLTRVPFASCAWTRTTEWSQIEAPQRPRGPKIGEVRRFDYLILGGARGKLCSALPLSPVKAVQKLGSRRLSGEHRVSRQRMRGAPRSQVLEAGRPYTCDSEVGHA